MGQEQTYGGRKAVHSEILTDMEPKYGVRPDRFQYSAVMNAFAETGDIVAAVEQSC